MQSRIRDLWENSGRTQRQVADAIGISQHTCSKLETEKQPLTDELPVKLADFYQVSIDYILRQTNNPQRNI